MSKRIEHNQKDSLVGRADIEGSKCQPTGKVLDLPAEEDLATYPVRVEGSLIYVGVPKT